MNTILVLAHKDDGQEARLQVSLDLARAWRGHLACMDGIAPVASSWDASRQFATAELLIDECLRKTANETRLKARLARENVAWNWIDGSGFLGESLEAASDLADLVVLSIGPGNGESPELRKLTAYLAMERRGPVLAVPHDVSGLDAEGTALVVWDGSRPADEALRGAVRLLALSRQVILLNMEHLADGSAKGRRPYDPAKLYLAEQGIHAKLDPGQRQPNATIAAAILDKAHAVDAAYIVMGAAGRSLTDSAETIRLLLAHSDLPVFIARG